MESENDPYSDTNGLVEMATDTAAKVAAGDVLRIRANAEAPSIMSAAIFVFLLTEKKMSGHLKLRVSSS